MQLHFNELLPCFKKSNFNLCFNSNPIQSIKRFIIDFKLLFSAPCGFTNYIINHYSKICFSIRLHFYRLSEYQLIDYRLVVIDIIPSEDYLKLIEYVMRKACKRANFCALDNGNGNSCLIRKHY